MNDNMDAAELAVCMEIVSEATRAIKEPGRNVTLAITNETGHVTTLRFGSLTLYVYRDGSGIDIQARGSGIKRYEDTGEFAALLRESDEKALDDLRDIDSATWVSLVSEALGEAKSDPSC